jgi:acetyl coenzyme A synthetase (ADP forming)-like protein
VKGNESSMKYLFEPRGVAIIGASQSPGKIGYKVVENIVVGGYRGRVYPINPRGGEVLGLPVYKRMEDIEGPVDVAVIVVPADIAFSAMEECAKKQTKFAIIITSGFSEVGNVAEERKIARFAREHGIRVIGPNVFGMYSSVSSLNATFGPSDVKSGNVAIITQSGAIGIAMIGKTKVEGIGLSAMISVGNKSDVDETDLLDYLTFQDDAKVVLMYLEGIKSGERLVEVLKKATRRKPVVVIKSGRSSRGAQAAASHTGSLAGEDKVFDDVARQCGVIRAESIQEALNWCKFLADAPMPLGEDCVIITNGGGIGVLTADACEKYGVNLSDEVADLKKTFESVMPSFGSAKNPVDITGGASPEDYDKALVAALENNNIDSVACLGCQTGSFNAPRFAQIAEERYLQYKPVKPIVFSLFGGEEVEHSIVELKAKGIPVFSDVYEMTAFLGALYKDYRNKTSLPVEPATADIDTAAIDSAVASARADGRHFLLSHEAQQVMRAARIIIPQSRIAHNPDEAVRYAEEIGYPVVMKVISKDIIHKSDAGGVALDLENRKEVLDAYEAIMRNCRAYKADAVIEGMQIDEMIKRGVETIVGARRDKSFGPTVMFGLGGVYVEVLKDIAFRSFPLSREETLNMIGQIHSYPLLLGVRGEARKDIDEVANTITKVGWILRNCTAISDIEVNPLVVYDHGDGVKAVDVRILLRESEEA